MHPAPHGRRVEGDSLIRRSLHVDAGLPHPARVLTVHAVQPGRLGIDQFPLALRWQTSSKFFEGAYPSRHFLAELVLNAHRRYRRLPHLLPEVGVPRQKLLGRPNPREDGGELPVGPRRHLLHLLEFREGPNGLPKGQGHANEEDRVRRDVQEHPDDGVMLTARPQAVLQPLEVFGVQRIWFDKRPSRRPDLPLQESGHGDRRTLIR